jgi:hypothetical protein
MFWASGQGYPILQLGISFGKIGVSSVLWRHPAAYEEGMKYAKEKNPSRHTDRQIPVDSAEGCRSGHAVGIIPLAYVSAPGLSWPTISKIP